MPEDSVEVLLVALDKGCVEAGQTAWSRAGQHAEALRSYGVVVHPSGTFPPRLYPWGWKDGALGAVRKAFGVAAGAAKRVAQSFTLPKYDTVLVLRDVLVFTGPPFFERLFAERANFLVFELDDAIWLPDGNNPPPLWTPRKTEEAAALADRVIAGNEFIAEWARQRCDDVVVIPTCGGDYIQPRGGPRKPGPIRVGWSGHPAGAHFLDHVMPAVAAAHARVGFELALISQPPALDIVRDVQGLHRSLTVWESPLTEESLHDFDIGLMPLDASEFAKGKSAFKIVRYMAAGLPVVASPVGANVEVVVEGETGFLASTPEEWADAIVALVEDSTLRERMGAAGRARYESNYSSAAVLPLYAAALTPPPDRRVDHGGQRQRWSRRLGRQRGGAGA